MEKVGRKGNPPAYHAHVAGWLKSNDIQPISVNYDCRERYQLTKNRSKTSRNTKR